jgi:glycosyltransferase involved in cell wall biosynthesis
MTAKNKPRICFIRQSPYPYELSFRREVETLRDAGFETHVISLKAKHIDSKHTREEIIDGVHVHRLPLRRQKTHLLRYLYDYGSFFLLASLRCTLMHLKRPFQFIQVNTMPDFLVFTTFLPRLWGARVGLMMQEPVPELWKTQRNTRPPRILALVEQAALAYADRVFTVTQQLKDTYVSRGADPEKITVMLNVPESSYLDLGEPPLQPDPDTFTLICHGAIEERYGHDTILKAMARIKDQAPNLRLKILGRGSYLEEFLALIKELDLQEQVDYLGFVSLDQMVRELQTSDVGIVAQKSSPYSNLVHTNKMYEFIALGKPVIASRLKSVEAYFHDQALRYFEPANPDSLSEAILDLYHHPEKRRSLVEHAEKLYQQYQWAQQRERYLSVYRSLLDDEKWNMVAPSLE